MKTLVAWAYDVSTRGPGPCFALWGSVYFTVLIGGLLLAWWLA